MISLKRIAPYVCLAALAASAQTRIDFQTQGKNLARTGTLLPATCSMGDLFVNTDSTPGQNLYLCTAANTWTVQGSALVGVFSAVSSLPASCSPGVEPQVVYLTSGTAGLYQCTAADTWSPSATSLLPGAGLLTVCTSVSCTIAIDPAWPGVTNTAPGYSATSNTSLTVGTGPRTLTTQSGLAYSTGASVVLTSQSSGAWMFGMVSSYSGSTMVVNVSNTAGTGAYADWTINVSANPAGSVPSGAPNQVLATDPSGASVDAAALRPLVPGDLPSGYPWSSLAGVPARFTPSSHATSHQNGGSDEVATATPSPFAIPKAGANSKLAQGWIDFTGYQTTTGTFPWSQLTGVPSFASISTATVLKGSGGNAVAAASSDVISLWSGDCSSTTFLRGDGSCSAVGSGGQSGGTVSSVGLSLSDLFAVSGSPITGSGTLTATLTSQGANAVFAGPAAGPNTPPAFRSLVPADLPANYNAPTATALAGMPSQCAANNFATGIAASGNANCAQPAFTNISGTAAASQIPSSLRVRAIGYAFDGGGLPLTQGKIGYFTVPFACTLSAWNATADTGTITFDVWKTGVGQSIPTSANSITASALPAISTGTAARSTALTGWITSVAANDIFGVQVKSVSSATLASLVLECDQ